MIKDFKRGEWVEKTDYELRFYRDANGGFAFPCDKDGNPLMDPDNKAAWDNYHECLKNPEEFPYYFNHKVANTHSWREPNSGTCYCGTRIELVNEYMGACECPKCGKWYNLFGQELKNPEHWDEGDDW